MYAETKTLSWPSSVAKLTAEQWRFVDRLADSDRTFAVLQAGFGKTITSLLGCIERLDAGDVRRWLVIAPLRPAKNWAEDWHDWSLAETGYDLALAVGAPAAREKAFRSGAGIVVTNIENAVWAVEAGLLDGFDGLVIDEISKLKSVSGAAFKKLRRAVKRFKLRVGLSATPVAEGLEHLYGQVMLLDDGARLGTNKETFLREYFYPTDFQQRNWSPKPDTLERLTGLLDDLLYVDDVGYREGGLPELVLDVMRIDMPDEAHKLASELSKYGQVTLDKAVVSAASAGVLTSKRLQIASGFVYDDTRLGVRVHNAKAQAVRRLIEASLRRGENVLVAYQYAWEQEQLRHMYPDIVDVREKGAVDAWSRGEVPVMMLHPKSGGHGLNLQYGGFTLVVWTMPWSLDLWDQMIRRLLRRGQTSEHVFVRVPVVRGSEDERVLDALERKLRGQDEFNTTVRDVFLGKRGV